MSTGAPPSPGPGQYVLRAIFGAWRYALYDKTALGWFDLSLTGFRRSFWAMPMVAPIYLLSILTVAPDAADAGVTVGVGTGLAIYGAKWIAFPLLMIPISRLLGLSQNYVSLIIVHNWSQVVIVMALLPINLARLGGGATAGAVGPAALVVGLAILAYNWFIARQTLRAGALTAVGIVLLDEISGGLIIVLGGMLVAG